MYSAIEIGPWAAISAAMRWPSAFIRAAAGATRTGNRRPRPTAGSTAPCPWRTSRGTARPARGRPPQEPEQAVAQEEQSRQQPRPLMQLEHPQADLEQDEQHNAFQRGLIKLARMARLVVGAREDHGPRHVRR